MFEKWSEFYITIGGSAVGLIGLLFVVVTLSAASEAAREREGLDRGHAVYASPTVFHLGVVLLVSVTALAPDLPRLLCGIVFFACAVAGLIYTQWVIRQFRSAVSPPGFEPSDLWFYGVVPQLIYGGFLIVAAMVALQTRLAAHFLSLAAICLLLTAIFNAWDLAGWLAHPARKQKRALAAAPKADGVAGT